MKIAVYPGSFDPFTNGHEEILRRGLEVFDRVIVAVASNSSKKHLFHIDNRVDMIARVLADRDAREKAKRKPGIIYENVNIHRMDGLTVDFCEAMGAKFILRGIRALTDYEYENALAQMNDAIRPIETVCLFASRENAFISSSFIREIARHGKDISKWVHPIVEEECYIAFKAES